MKIKTIKTQCLFNAEHILGPDGSEIRELVATDSASMVHCTLYPGAISRAVRHKSVEELWFIIEGRGQFWRKTARSSTIIKISKGTSLNIPKNVDFQFRNNGTMNLEAIIMTIPPWPGNHEAIISEGPWEVRNLG